MCSVKEGTIRGYVDVSRSRLVEALTAPWQPQGVNKLCLALGASPS